MHRQGYAALGVYSSLFALGAVVSSRDGPRYRPLGASAGIAGVLGLMPTGSLLLLVGANPVMWALAMVCCGAFDTLRFVPTMILPDSFGHMPLAWGYAIFDTLTGVPMVCGATLGGLSLPDVVRPALPGRDRHRRRPARTDAPRGAPDTGRAAAQQAD